MENYCLIVRFPKEMEEKMKDAAWRKRMSLSDYIRDLVAKDLKEVEK